MPDVAHDGLTPEEPVTPRESSLGRALGAGYGAIAHLGLTAVEVVPVALESVTGQGAEIATYTAGLTDFDSLAADLANIDHLEFDLQVAFSQTEALRAALLVPSISAGALLGLDGARHPVRSAGFDSSRPSRISEQLRELLDLLSLTLFTHGLAGTEVILAEHGTRAERTRGLVPDLVLNSATARVDVVVALESGVTAPVTLILPLALLVRLAAPPRRAAANAIESTRGPARPIDILVGGSLRVSVELGGSSMTAEEILELGPGSVVELNRLTAEPLDIIVNDRLIARGEVLVVDEKFGVRITEISSPRQRANAIER